MSLRKFIAPSTLSSQRPLPAAVFYQIISWRPWRSLRETQSYPIFLHGKIQKCLARYWVSRSGGKRKAFDKSLRANIILKAVVAVTKRTMGISTSVKISPADYLATKGTKHALSKAEGSTKEEKLFLKPDGFVNPVLRSSCPSYHYNSNLARLAQIFRKLKTLGFGCSSRQDAKTLSDRPKACHPERIRGI